MKYVAPLMLAAIVIGAAPAPAKIPSYTNRIEVTQGLVVEPVAVIEDSRCPPAALCVTAGRFVVAVKVIAGGNEIPARLTLGAATKIADGWLTLTAVTPEWGSQTTVLQNYRFAFTFGPTPPHDDKAELR